MMSKVVSRIASRFLLAALSLFAVAQAQAVIYTDHQVINETLSRYNPAYESEFNIYQYGFRPASEDVISAGVAFLFYDADLREERVEINLGQEELQTGIINKGFTVFGGLLSCDALIDINEDGKISYDVRWVSGDSFRLVSGTLTACATASAPANGVPDGGTTVAMLGFAMLVIGGAHRKFKARA
ncbi:MAG TPA: VPDSG-CTERM sorting domain-containing protein [Blastocatellia bacterium]|nr:VPDSG-CTERM sorting domain-containing protein [Blastocatellia bacterium]